FCIFRNFCLAGCSIFRPRLSYSLFWFSTCRSGFSLRLDCCWLLALVGKNLTLEHPDLDTDNTVGGLRLGNTVINISAQCMQRHTTLAVPFGTRNFNTVQTPGTHNLDALGTEA